jgi:hypothetical protein
MRVLVMLIHTERLPDLILCCVEMKEMQRVQRNICDTSNSYSSVRTRVRVEILPHPPLSFTLHLYGPK